MNVQAILETKGSDVVSIAPTATLQTAVHRLAEHRIGALLVLGPDHRVIGIVSERDIVRVLARHGAAVLSEPLSTVMTRTVVTCTRSDTIGDIMETYLREGVVDWTFTLENGDHRPCDDEGLDWLMDDYELAYPIANAAAEVYTEAIFRPLGVKMEPTPSSRTSRNTRSTSRKSRPSPSRP